MADWIPAEFDGGISLSAFNGHICQGTCTPIEPQGGDWTATPHWKPGETHSASLTTKYVGQLGGQPGIPVQA